MAEIKELGESLLQRAEKRNDQQYKRSRREAYKIALGTAGMGMINEVLQKKADAFMQSEQVLAQKAKYRSAVQQANSILTMNEEIVKSGKTAEQYFADTRYLPAMQEQFKAQYGSNVVPTTYMPQLLEQARGLAAEDAARFRESLEAAQTIPDYETAMSSVDSLVMPPRTPAGALFRKVSNIFTGKSEQDFRDQAVEQVRERGLIKNETWEKLFNDVSAQSGIDAAVAFVSRMDSRGFTDIVEFETKIEMVPDGNGGFNVLTAIVATNIPPGGARPEPVVQNVRVARPTVTNQVLQGVGDRVFDVTTQTGETGSEIIKVEERRVDINSEEGRLATAKALIDATDLSAWAKDIFNPQGMSTLAAELNDLGVSLVDIRTPEQYAQVAGKLMQLQANENFLLDPEGNATRRDAIAAIVEASASLQQELLFGDPSEERRGVIINRINRLLDDIGNVTSNRNVSFPGPTDRRPGAPTATQPPLAGRDLLNQQLYNIDNPPAQIDFNWADI